MTYKLMKSILSDGPEVYEQYCTEDVLPKVLVFANGLVNMKEDTLVEFEKYHSDYRQVRQATLSKLHDILVVCQNTIQEAQQGHSI